MWQHHLLPRLPPTNQPFAGGGGVGESHSHRKEAAAMVGVVVAVVDDDDDNNNDNDDCPRNNVVIVFTKRRLWWLCTLMVTFFLVASDIRTLSSVSSSYLAASTTTVSLQIRNASDSVVPPIPPPPPQEDLLNPFNRHIVQLAPRINLTFVTVADAFAARNASHYQSPWLHTHSNDNELSQRQPQQFPTLTSIRSIRIDDGDPDGSKKKTTNATLSNHTNATTATTTAATTTTTTTTSSPTVSTSSSPATATAPPATPPLTLDPFLDPATFAAAAPAVNVTDWRQQDHAFWNVSQRQLGPLCRQRDAFFTMIHQQIKIVVNHTTTTLPATTTSTATTSTSSTASSTTKLMCIVYTTHRKHKSQMRLIRDTWGNKCDGFVAGSTHTDPTVHAIAIPHRGQETYQNMWQKVRTLWSFIYHTYYHEYDWFHMGGDDMYVMVENLKAYLASDEIRQAAHTNATHQTPLYLGNRHYIHGKPSSGIFHDGGAGYTLNKAALKALVVHGLPYSFQQVRSSAEDVHVAWTLARLGIFPYDTKDAQGGERYNARPPDFLYQWRPTNSTKSKYYWFTKFQMDTKWGFDHCARYSVSFHRIRDEDMIRLHALLYNLCPPNTTLTRQPPNQPGPPPKQQLQASVSVYKKQDSEPISLSTFTTTTTSSMASHNQTTTGSSPNHVLHRNDVLPKDFRAMVEEHRRKFYQQRAAAKKAAAAAKGGTKHQ